VSEKYSAALINSGLALLQCPHPTQENKCTTTRRHAHRELQLDDKIIDNKGEQLKIRCYRKYAE